MTHMTEKGLLEERLRGDVPILPTVCESQSLDGSLEKAVAQQEQRGGSSKHWKKEVDRGSWSCEGPAVTEQVDIKVITANVTSFRSGLKFAQQLDKDIDFVLMQELRIDEEEIGALRAKFRKCGFWSYFEESQITEAGAKSSGVALLWRPHHVLYSEPSVLVPHRLLVGLFKVRGSFLRIGTFYAPVGAPWQIHQQHLMEICKWEAMSPVPLVVGGDWNLPSAVVKEFLTAALSSVCVANSGEYTCFAGDSMSDLDFFAVSRCLRGVVKVSSLEQYELATHRPQLLHIPVAQCAETMVKVLRKQASIGLEPVVGPKLPVDRRAWPHLIALQ